MDLEGAIRDRKMRAEMGDGGIVGLGFQRDDNIKPLLAAERALTGPIVWPLSILDVNFSCLSLSARIYN